ncbi:predicted protein [Plenodomus lingam JN3]|uniref:Predicted protein n=2 Tax=Leptosphaeria maculans TaxID=5022 RepID=E5A090_LEPMJ|nr:predicted protein [Plenodomus lingam JN3]CBX96950.1 predicted protein [Plenodomus lingam JN3]
MNEDIFRGDADDDLQTNSDSLFATEASDLSPPLSDPLEVDYTVTPQDANDNDEEFGEFVSASTDPFKQPVFSTVDNDDEAQSLLTIDSDSGVEFGEIAGTGIVPPVLARLENSTRRIRQAGKNVQYKWRILQGIQLSKIEFKAQPAVVCESPAPTTALEELAEFARVAATTTEVIKQQKANHSAVEAVSLDWVVRPVCFGMPLFTEIPKELIRDLEDYMEAERAAWSDFAV